MKINLQKIQVLLLVLATHFIAYSSIADQQSYPFKLINQAEGGKHILLAQNKGPAPVLLNLNLASDNAIIEPAAHIVEVIKPAAALPTASIRSKAAGQGYRVASNYKFSIGDPDAIPDPAVTYQLPFANGQKVLIGQILGGKITTHTGPDSKYAVDFDVPIGTPVLAARSGVVVDIDQGYTAGGNDPKLKANHVLILHEDGTLGLYAHLRAESHAVTFGQMVKTGELIGYSGNTGYSSGPHLHFSVLTNTRTADGSVKYVSHPVKFVNGMPAQAVEFHQNQIMQVSHEILLTGQAGS